MTHPALVADGALVHVAVQTPLMETEAIELAASSNIFRKQVLRAGSINYQGKRLDFTPAYLDGLALAYREGAYDAVPFVFTDSTNAHTQDVERIRGEILGFERSGDGLDAIVKVANPKAAQIIRDFPKLGVSVRIEQPLDRADGKHWPAAIQHVLATTNPRVTGMRPWEPVELANGDLPVIDLSTYDFTEGDLREDPTDQKETEMADTPSFTPEEVAKVRALLSVMEADTADDDTDDTEFEMPSDEELAAIAAGLFADDVVEEAPVEVAASSDNGAVELAAQLDAQRIELAQLRQERDVERYEKLRESLARDHGIPPRVTELAKPLLMGKQVIELANGNTVDAGDVMRKVLTAIGEHVKIVDLSSDTIYDTDADTDAEAEAKRRADDAAAYRRNFGL